MLVLNNLLFDFYGWILFHAYIRQINRCILYAWCVWLSKWDEFESMHWASRAAYAIDSGKNHFELNYFELLREFNTNPMNIGAFFRMPFYRPKCSFKTTNENYWIEFIVQCFREWLVMCGFYFSHENALSRTHSIIQSGKLYIGNDLNKSCCYIALNFIYALPIRNTRCQWEFFNDHNENSFFRQQAHHGHCAFLIVFNWRTFKPLLVMQIFKCNFERMKKNRINLI